MKVAIYPGSFNPWHAGHEDILTKAMDCFDEVVIAIGTNPEKELSEEVDTRIKKIENELYYIKPGYVHIESFDGLLVDYIDSCKYNIDAVVRGLRNGHDLQYEMNQQYWNEDLGLTIPVVYFICARNLSHISSSTIRMVSKIKNA